jgi:thymidine phosphorylase
VDGEGQMIACIIKRLLQVPHVVIDIPIGKTAKVRTEQDAENQNIISMS